MDWESRYQNQDTPWDKGRSHPVTGELANQTLPEGAILAPGCGAGWDLAALAETHSTRRIIGLDIAPSAVEAARKNNLHFPRVEAHLGDFLSGGIDPTFGPIALIWEHTCFCAIHPTQREAYAAAAARALPSGGFLCGVFFIELDDGGSGPPWNCPQPEWRAIFAADFEVVRAGAVHTTFPGRDGEEWGAVLRRR
ncbi:MAG: methyltransferase domain-containing protein [Verrucomicrobiales bacterium]